MRVTAVADWLVHHIQFLLDTERKTQTSLSSRAYLVHSKRFAIVDRRECEEGRDGSNERGEQSDGALHIDIVLVLYMFCLQNGFMAELNRCEV